MSISLERYLGGGAFLSVTLPTAAAVWARLLPSSTPPAKLARIATTTMYILNENQSILKRPGSREFCLKILSIRSQYIIYSLRMSAPIPASRSASRS